MRVAIALSPTLIFTLVLATILRERVGLTETWYGALLVYAALTTLLPSLILAKPFQLDAIKVAQAGSGPSPDELAPPHPSKD